MSGTRGVRLQSSCLVAGLENGIGLTGSDQLYRWLENVRTNSQQVIVISYLNLRGLKSRYVVGIQFVIGRSGY